MKKFFPVIARSGLFRGISEEELPELLGRLDPKTASYSKGEYILHAGDTVSSLGLVLSGSVLIVKEDFWGNRNIISSLGPCQCFAETFASAPGAVLGVSVSCAEDCTILFLSVKKMLELPQSSEHHNFLVRNLLSDIAAKNLAFTEKLTHLGQRTTREKILSYLSMISQKKGTAEFDIPFSRQQLADYLFVDRSGLSNELCKMRGEGLIDFRKNHFVLHIVN